MATLFDLLRKTYLSLGHLQVSTATSGTKNIITDTKLGDTYGDGDITGSAIFIIRDAGGDSAAPEGEVSYVIDYISSTNTMSVSPAFTAAVSVGDKYGIAKPIIDLETMIEIANDALQGLGTIQLFDTSITTLDDVTEYQLPKHIKYKVAAVMIQTSSDTDNYEYVDINNWYVLNTSPGTVGELVFNRPLSSGYKLKIIYEAEHPRLNSMSDSVSETIHSEYATKLVVDKALEYQVRRTNGTDQFLLQTQNKSMMDLQDARSRFHTQKRKRPKYITPMDDRRYFEEEDD